MNYNIKSNSMGMVPWKPLLPLLLAVFSFFGCYHNPQNGTPHTQSPNNPEIQKKLIVANRQAVKTEDQQIEDFVERHGWEMKITGTGLRYLIYQHGSGVQAQEGMLAHIVLQASLLNGEIIYNANKTKPLTIKIGQDAAVPTGIHQGILLLHSGDRAKFILPSHLAFGLTGDQNKVPPKSTLVYDIQLVELR
jgi:FKBP-type peptidyl-prolyl cis-trans isomerase